MAAVTSLSGNEVFCMSLKGYEADEVVFGNSVITRGFFGAIKSTGNNVIGGEVPQVTQAISHGRMNAFARMAQAAYDLGATGMAGVTNELRELHDHPEFILLVHAFVRLTPPHFSLARATLRNFIAIWMLAIGPCIMLSEISLTRWVSAAA